MRNNEYYQEYHLQDTAVERLSQKIAQNKATKGLTVKRKFEAVLGILFFGMVIIPTIIGTLVQSGHLAPFTPSFMEVEQEPTIETSQKPVESPTSHPITVQGVNVATEGNPVKIGASQAQNDLIAYAWEKYQDKMFIYLIEAESGVVNKRSQRKGSNGHYDYGYMQINDGYHKAIVGAKEFKINDDSVEQGKYQIDIGYKLYKGGTKFYGLDKLRNNKEFYNAVAKNFIWD